MDRVLLGIIRIITGLLFFQHGAEKMWGFAGGRIDRDFTGLHGIAGPIEVVGGTLIVLGLFARPTAFILCGQMAVAYFRNWAPRGFFPLANGGEEAVLFCYLFLWIVAAGAGSWSLDSRLAKEPYRRLSVWESQARSVMRIVFGFILTQHGLRLAWGMFAVGGRRLGAPLALDQLPPLLGYFEVAAGVLLMLGLFARPAALSSSVLAFAAYLYAAAPRGPWPIRNGGNEALLYAFVFLYIGVVGAGRWSLDSIRHANSAAPVPDRETPRASAPLPQ